MSRNFTPDETLIDQLLLNDTSAFEELHHRYCYPLYSYCIGKLDSPEDARRIVRDIFIALWENRQHLKTDFSISLHLYTEVRKAVVRCIDEKLLDTATVSQIEKQVIPGFSVIQLQKASKPVNAKRSYSSNNHLSVNKKRNYGNPWWNNYPAAFDVKGIKHALQSMLNFL
jgi:hypothetical protein